MARTFHLLTSLILTTLVGCATVDFDYPKTSTTAPAPTETADTRLGRGVGDLTAGRPPDVSGFHMLPNAVDALAARLLLASRAERTIDAQYYLIKADTAGRAFVRALIRAADRGVRVRLLIDDMFTSGLDVGWAAVDHHPNVEVRIFNPFASRTARFRDGITSFSRINRRMHNKSFTIDNQVTIVGGRNIADEYFGTRSDARFGDLDVVGIGPVVQEVSDSFDLYWNHERSMPLPAFAKMPDDPDDALATLRVRLDERLAEAEASDSGSVYANALQQSILRFMDANDGFFTWAPYELAVDSPDKSFKDLAETADSITSALQESLLSAEDEILLVSPYFVPLKSGIRALQEFEARGIHVTVITNSLAANNQFTVHGGYAPSRKPLLRAGVEIYEVRRDAEFGGQEFFAASGAKSTLHTKAFIVDRRELFIGSFNFDPRSARINTEMGVIIRSPEMAQVSADAVDAALPNRAWKVELDDRGRLRWSGLDAGGQRLVYDREPQTSWWDRFRAGVVRILPIRGQL